MIAFTGLRSTPRETPPKKGDDMGEMVQLSAAEQAAHFYMLGVILNTKRKEPPK